MKGDVISLWKVLLCCQKVSELVYLLRVGFQNLVRGEALPCELSFGAIDFWFTFCDPFVAWEAKGKEEYP
jgi:hypothetical protein